MPEYLLTKWTLYPLILIMTSQMISQQRQFDERLITQCALVRIVATVHSNMISQVSKITEGLFTQHALVWLVCQMDLHVSLEVAAFSECMTADVAFERFVHGVCSQMPNQFAWLSKREVTERAPVWLIF